MLTFCLKAFPWIVSITYYAQNLHGIQKNYVYLIQNLHILLKFYNFLSFKLQKITQKVIIFDIHM